ncbi:hypothetical protein Q31a_32710 [Aureliella helgolandensis]|uniref:Uncharacterized protein n=1 Tax=Aureliella helgolandensis TaxID=2527968 RepID=A0A518G8Q1_9BACT|nr:hypothetical protein Q31a_32710 [Aureliella helgolandensis]
MANPSSVSMAWLLGERVRTTARESVLVFSLQKN